MASQTHVDLISHTPLREVQSGGSFLSSLLVCSWRWPWSWTSLAAPKEELLERQCCWCGGLTRRPLQLLSTYLCPTPRGPAGPSNKNGFGWTNLFAPPCFKGDMLGWREANPFSRSVETAIGFHRSSEKGLQWFQHAKHIVWCPFEAKPRALCLLSNFVMHHKEVPRMDAPILIYSPLTTRFELFVYSCAFTYPVLHVWALRFRSCARSHRRYRCEQPVSCCCAPRPRRCNSTKCRRHMPRLADRSGGNSPSANSLAWEFHG